MIPLKDNCYVLVFGEAKNPVAEPPVVCLYYQASSALLYCYEFDTLTGYFFCDFLVESLYFSLFYCNLIFFFMCLSLVNQFLSIANSAIAKMSLI